MVVFGISFHDFKLGFFWGKNSERRLEHEQKPAQQVFNVVQNNTTIQNTLNVGQTGEQTDSYTRVRSAFDYAATQPGSPNFPQIAEQRVYSEDRQVFFDPSRNQSLLEHSDFIASRAIQSALRFPPQEARSTAPDTATPTANSQPADEDDGLTPIQRAWKFASSDEWNSVIGYDPTYEPFARAEDVSSAAVAVEAVAHPVVVEGDQMLVDVVRSKRSELALSQPEEMDLTLDGRFLHPSQMPVALEQTEVTPSEPKNNSWFSFASFDRIQKYLNDFYNRDIKGVFQRAFSLTV